MRRLVGIHLGLALCVSQLVNKRQGKDKRSGIDGKVSRGTSVMLSSAVGRPETAAISAAVARDKVKKNFMMERNWLLGRKDVWLMVDNGSLFGGQKPSLYMFFQSIAFQ